MHTLIMTTKQAATITPEAVRRCRMYTQYFITDGASKLKQGGVLDTKSQAHTVQPTPETLKQAKELYAELEILENGVMRVYRYNFVKIANVIRQARLDLGATRVEEVEGLELVATLLIQMLKAENPYFNKEKFRAHINS